MKNPTLLLAVLLAACVGLTGCESKQNRPVYTIDGDLITNAPIPLTPNPRSVVPDAPMPEGFQLIESRSRSVVADGSRLIYHIYQGKATESQMATYLRITLGQYNWERGKETIKRGDIVMEFSKGRELLIVHIFDRKTHLDVTMQIVSRTQLQKK